MATLAVECLRCGAQHELRNSPGRRLQSGGCPRCGYVGWAAVGAVDEHLRELLRARTSVSRGGFARH